MKINSLLILCLLLPLVSAAQPAQKAPEQATTPAEYQKQAIEYQKQCDSGSMESCRELGLLYANGQGVHQDYVQASKLFDQACNGGEQLGCDNYRELQDQGY